MVATRHQPVAASAAACRRRDNLTSSLLGRPLSGPRRQSWLQHPLPSQALLTGLLQSRLSRQLPSTLRPFAYRIGQFNKAFACDWLDRDTVLMATKCNNLLRLSLLDGAVERIPLLGLSGRGGNQPAGLLPMLASEGGVHAMEINQPVSFLATGARVEGELGVYELPSLRPYALLQGAHSDWVFDAVWLDPATCLSVARDSSMAVWSLPERDADADCGSGFAVASPRFQRLVYDLNGQPGAKLRSVDIGRCGSIALLSLNSFLNFYSQERLDTPVVCVSLGAEGDANLAKETVCVRASSEPHCFYVRCVDQVTLYDSRLRKPAFSVESRDKKSGVRSLACNGPVVSYGTGVGNVYFYDSRSRRHLRSCLPLPSPATSQAGLQQDAPHQFRDHNYLQQGEYSVEQAVYSHRYDPDCSRIFATGGPLSAFHWGNLAVLYS